MFDSIKDLFRDRRLAEFSDPSNPIYADYDAEDPDDMPDAPEHGFKIALRKKRKAAMLKRMLADGGYADLAKMITVKQY